MFVTLQVIDMIANLYENQLPVRFGVILYSTTFIEKVERSGGENFADSIVSSTDEDISSLVIYYLLLCLLRWFYSVFYGIECFISNQTLLFYIFLLENYAVVYFCVTCLSWKKRKTLFSVLCREMMTLGNLCAT